MASLKDLVFVLDRDGSLHVKSRADAVGYFEAIDVAAGEYGPAWTSSGQRLAVEVDRRSQVTIRDEGDSDLEQLERVLLGYATKHDLALDDTGDVVLDVANAVSAWEWRARWPKRPRWLAVRVHGADPLRYTRP